MQYLYRNISKQRLIRLLLLLRWRTQSCTGTTPITDLSTCFNTVIHLIIWNGGVHLLIVYFHPDVFIDFSGGHFEELQHYPSHFQAAAAPFQSAQPAVSLTFCIIVLLGLYLP